MQPTPSAVRRLEGAWLLRDLERAALERLAAGATERLLQPGEVLMREGERGDAMYLVVSGALEVTRGDPGGVVVLGEVRRGEHVGEQALLEQGVRAATVTALEASLVVEVTRVAFEACLEAAPQSRSTFAQLASYRRAWARTRRIRPGRDEVVRQLARFFEELLPSQLEPLADECCWVSVPRGAVLFRQGESGDAVFFVLRGLVEVFAERDDGRSVRLGEVGPGEPVGEMALLSGEARMASARAHEDVEVLSLSRAGFDALLARHPTALALFARTMAARLSRAARGRTAIAQLRGATLVTEEDCAQAVSLVDPVLLNLTITQLYHRIAMDLTLLLGAQDANWFCFGCRASKTAGASIRLEEVPLREVLEKTPLWPLLARGVDRARQLSLVRLFEDALQTVAERVARGNRFIFEEIGPAFVHFVRAFAKAEQYDRAALEAVLARFTPGPSDRGGQDTLKGALSAYYEAAFEPSPGRRSELILLGSMKVGLHEQTRVGPLLEEALDAPLEVFFDQALALVPRPARSLVRPVRGQVRARLRALLTQRMMRMRLPDITLELGADVPGFREGARFPAALERLEHPETRAVYESLTAGAPSRARDWTRLEDRMRYIATLFRTRQKSLQLFEPPYLDAQLADIRARRIPAGAL